MPAHCGEPGAELDPSPLRLCACALQAAASGLPRETAAPARVVAPCSSPVVATCPRSLGPSPPLPDLAGVGVLSDCPLQPASGEPRAAIPGPGSLLRSSPLPRWKKLAPAAAPSRAERAPRLHGALGSPGMVEKAFGTGAGSGSANYQLRPQGLFLGEPVAPKMEKHVQGLEEARRCLSLGRFWW
ncbi:uncharacterized protein AAG666_001514 isoform 1-T12 [Megaptera novaeangliae]